MNAIPWWWTQTLVTLPTMCETPVSTSTVLKERIHILNLAESFQILLWNVFKGIVEAHLEAHIKAQRLNNAPRRSNCASPSKRSMPCPWGICSRHTFWAFIHISCEVHTSLEQTDITKKKKHTKWKREKLGNNVNERGRTCGTKVRSELGRLWR